MPASSKKLREYLHLPENKWEYVTVTDLEAIELTKIEPLFTRI